MADQIVACPGCGKKFKIPDGAAPTGSFPCTACGKDVPWGKSPALRPAGKAAPAAAPARSKPAAAAPQVQAPVRQAPAAKGRRARDDQDEPKVKQKGPKEEKLSGGMLAMIIGLVLLVVIIIAVNSGRNDDAPVVPVTPVTPQPAPTPAADQPPTPTAQTPVAPPKPATGGTSPGAADSGGSGGNESSGIGGTRNETKSSYGQWYKAPDLFAAFDSVEGTTPEERAKFDEDAALFANPNAGREATVAGSRLKKAGKKAIPSILGEFAKQWNAGKWATDVEKQSSFALQTLLKEIVKASDPTKGFVARWSRGVEVAPTEFEKAARIWCAWWRSEGKDLTEFKPFAE